MLEYVGVAMMGAGMTISFYGARIRSERTVVAGLALTLAGGALTVSGSSLEVKKMEGASRFNLTPVPTDAATLESTPTRVFVTARPKHTLTPSPTETLPPTSTATETLTPTETPTSTPSATTTPQMMEVGLDRAKAVCHEKDFPEWLKSGFVSVQVDRETIIEDCVGMTTLEDGTVEYSYWINKEELDFDYWSQSFVTVYAPYTLLDDGKYMLSIPECDDNCVLALIDAGGVQVGDALQSSLGGTTATVTVNNNGHTDGFIKFTIADTGGGQAGKFRVTKIYD